MSLAAAARALVPPGGRALLGITGPPGAGKSTLAARLVAAVPGAVLVPLDGFHLDDAVLAELGRSDRKGAPDTFDADGYRHLLHRLVARDEDVVYAPAFRRELEASAAGAVAVPRDCPLVVTEGLWLLGPFEGVRPLLTACWYLDVDPRVRRERLVARHVAHGRSPAAARAWAQGSDEANAGRVADLRGRADRVLTERDIP